MSQLPMVIPVSPGELIDKITILRIKSERIVDVTKLRNVRTELAALDQVAQSSMAWSERLSQLTNELSAVNASLWQVEDDLRRLEAEQRFDAEFIELARSVYQLNDQRTAHQRAVNELVGSPFVEEKQHPVYHHQPRH